MSDDSLTAPAVGSFTPPFGAAPSAAAIVDALPLIVWTAAPDGRTTYLNVGWTAYTGQAAAEGIARGTDAHVHPDDLPGIATAWREHLPGGARAGEAFAFEYRLRGRDGAYRWHLGRVVPRATGDGADARVEWVGTGTDIHDRKVAEEALAHLNAVLQERGLELELSNQQLQEQAAELEAQTEELQNTAATLEERTEEAEAALVLFQTSEARFAAVQEASPDGFVLARAIRRGGTPGGAVVDYEYTYVNDAGARILNRAPESLIGRRMLELYPHLAAVGDGSAGGVLAAYARVLETGEPYRAEFEYAAPEFTGVLRVTAVRTGDGLAFSYSDVSDRARAERYVQQLLHVSSALVHALTPADVARAATRTLVRTLGASAAALCAPQPDGRTATLLGAHGFDAGAVAEFQTVPLDAPLPLPEALRTGHPLWLGRLAETLARYPALGSAERYATTRSAAVLPLSAGGRVLGAFTVAYAEEREFSPESRDLLEAVARQVAQALDRARLYDAERAARDEAEAARLRAEEANRSKSEFLANMSHELRTPLNAIAGYVQLLEMELHGPVTGDQLSALGRVRRAQQHLLGLINDVLNYAKVESGRVEYAVEAVDLSEVLRDVAPLIEPQLAAKGLAFEMQLPGPGLVGMPLLVWADAEKLRQVLLNLLSNAVKFTDAGGRVAVTVATRDAPVLGPDGAPHAGRPDAVFLRVTDTGQGIARDQQARIFDPFVQVHAGHTRPHEGTGLGLAISRDLARGMGGDLRVRSAPGEGATFTVTLRRVVDATGALTDRRAGDERRAEDERRADEDRRGHD